MIKILIPILCFIVFVVQITYGAFNMINSSARSVGMGNAYVAVADDINCILDNPAGLSNLKSWEATFTATKLNWGVDNMGEGFTAVGLPIKGIGGVGIGYYNFSHPLYSENVFYLAYSTPVPLFVKSAVSLSGKYLTKSYTSNEWTNSALNPDFTALSKSNFSIGVSIHSYINKDLALGLFIDDINSPGVGGQVDYGFQFPFNFVSGSSGNHMISLTIREKHKELVNYGVVKEEENTEKNKKN